MPAPGNPRLEIPANLVGNVPRIEIRLVVVMRRIMDGAPELRFALEDIGFYVVVGSEPGVIYNPSTAGKRFAPLAVNVSLFVKSKCGSRAGNHGFFASIK
jgi:hypothetical protein